MSPFILFCQNNYTNCVRLQNLKISLNYDFRNNLRLLGEDS